jgi:hypothetical protein
VSPAKWHKGKTIVEQWLRILEANPTASLDYKTLEKDRGFLVHLAMTFEDITPYLKGIHLTLASHLPGRNPDGWKMSRKAWIELVLINQHLDLPDNATETGTPQLTVAVPRLIDNLRALHSIFQSMDPPLISVRSSRCLEVRYGFGDASGTGFGSSFERQDGVFYQVGTWGPDQEDTSSNWKEFQNVVRAIELECETSKVKDTEVIFCTDNSTVEATFYKGSSTSPLLHQLVVRLRALQHKHGFRLTLVHVSGKRMIMQGTDGISRGELREGIAAGKPMLEFIPLHLSASQQSPCLRDWILTWASEETVFLGPDEWFTIGHDVRGWAHERQGLAHPIIQHGTYVWEPPPAAADAALEELRKARIKRHNSIHIILIPRLLIQEWRRLFFKATDVFIEIPSGKFSFWPELMCEPLFLGILLPYARHRPWIFRGTPKCQDTVRKLRRVLEEPEVGGWDILRELLVLGRRLPTMSKELLRKVLYFGKQDQVPQASGRTGKRRRPDDGGRAVKRRVASETS